MIFLLSFAPLALLRQKSRPVMMLGLVLLALSYAVVCLSQRISVVFIPLGLVFLGPPVGVLRWKHLVLALLVIRVGYRFFLPPDFLVLTEQSLPLLPGRKFPLFLGVAKQHPLLGIGLRTPREIFLKDYQVIYPYTNKEQFLRDIASIISADNIFLTFMAGIGFPFLICYLLAISILLFKLIRMSFKTSTKSHFSSLSAPLSHPGGPGALSVL